MKKILLIEDEEPIRRVLSKILTEENKGYDITESEDGKDGFLKLTKEDYDLVLCDIKMPKMDGEELLQNVRENGIDIPFIMLTGHGNISTAVEAMKAGAFDFISKPPDLNRLLTSGRKALEIKNIVTENIKLKKRIAKKYKIIGESEAINKINIMVENNVVSKKNLLEFEKSPFLMCNPQETYDIMNSSPENVKLLVDVAHLKVSSKSLNFQPKEFFLKCNYYISVYHLSVNNGFEDTNDKIDEKSWFW